jgi:TolA-binding protein
MPDEETMAGRMGRPYQHTNQDVMDAVHSVGQQIHGVSRQISALQSPDLLRAIQSLSQQITDLQKEVKTMSDTLDTEIGNLAANVAQLTTVDDSAVALLNGISQQLAAAIAAAQAGGATAAQLQSLNDLNAAVAAKSGDLAAAVTANTPAAPATP